MSYEVVKTIKGREYRYIVESYRDPDSGRSRSKWTYAGKVQGSEPRVKRRVPASQTRRRLIDAFLHLVDTLPWQKVTPGAVASEAGVAHGTFYRYFKDRQQLFELCTEQANEALDLRLGELEKLAATLEAERARLAAWIATLIREPAITPGLVRVWMEIGSEVLREKRHGMRVAALSRYVGTLRERRYASAIGNARPIAIALSFLIASFTRRTAYEHTLLSEDDYAAASESFDRLLFWLSPA